MSPKGRSRSTSFSFKSPATTSKLTAWLVDSVAAKLPADFIIMIRNVNVAQQWCLLVVRIMCSHFQVVMDRAFAHVLPKHIPSKTIPSNEVDLSVDVMVLESVSIVQMRRQMPLLTQII